MTKLLTIGMPTFNRAHELDQQLHWLNQEIKGFEQECEVAIYDNCSTDATPAVVEKWRSLFGQVSFKYVRNPENIGGLPNYAKCLSEATGTFVWAIGDDDPINPGTLAFIIKTLKERRHLALMFLNFVDSNKAKTNMGKECWLSTDLEPYAAKGADVFRRCIEKEIGAVLFITSNIYRTKLVQVALQKWAASVQNWAGVGYWAGYCALHGDVLVTRDPYAVCTIGESQWAKDGSIHIKIWCKDVPELCYKLFKLGYPYEMCKKVIKNSFRILENTYGNRAYPRAFRYWGMATVAALSFVYLPFTAQFESTQLTFPASTEVREFRHEEASD